jgi:uncharacterized protein with PQ loop repeat
MLYEFIEIAFSLTIFINAMLFVPQIIKILQQKNANGVSFFTFAGFNLIQLVMMAHGLIHHDWLLVIGMALSVITCGIVTVLTLIYK